MTIYNCDLPGVAGHLPGVAGFQTYNFGDNDHSIGFYSYGRGGVFSGLRGPCG